MRGMAANGQVWMGRPRHGCAWQGKETMRKITTSWKGFENRQAKRWGTHREGPTGKTGADFLTSMFAAQCKLWRTVPKKWTEALDNAVAAAKIHQEEIGSRVFGVSLIKKNSQGVPDDKTLVMMYQEGLRRTTRYQWKGEREWNRNIGSG